MRKAGIGVALLCVVALWWWTRDDGAERSARTTAPRAEAAGPVDRTRANEPAPAADSEDGDAKTEQEGIDVTVAVRFQDGRPAAGVDVTLTRHQRFAGRVATDSKGIASFPDRTEKYLLAHVGSGAFAIVRPRESPHAVMSLPKTKTVRLSVFCDGVRKIPDGLDVPGLFGLDINHSAAVVTGFTVEKNIVGESRTQPPVRFTVVAPGYRPVEVQLKEAPLEGEARLVRGVHTVLNVPGLRTPPRMQRIGGSSVSGSWSRDGHQYYLKPGRYIVRSAFLRSDIGVVTVPDQYKQLDVALETPEFTQIKIEAPEAAHLAKVLVHIGGERTELRARRVVLPGDEPVRFTVAHAMFLPDPDRGAVTRVQRGGVVTLVLIRAPLLRFSIRGVDYEGPVRLYRPGQYEKPVGEYTYAARVRSVRRLVNESGQLVNRPTKETALAAAVPLRGVYDVWIDTGLEPILVKSVRLSGADVDLGAFDQVRGSVVQIRLTDDESRRVGFRVRALDPPYFERTGVGNGVILFVHGLGKGRYAWSLGDDEGEIEVDGKTHIEIER